MQNKLSWELSYWEKNSFINYHYAVIGGGLVGLSTAISIKEFEPNASVVVFERGLLPSGASTRNAGFACFGSLSEILTDLEVLGEEFTVKLVHDRWNGLKMLRNRIGDAGLQFECAGGYELIGKAQIEYLDRLSEVNRLLHPIFGKEVFQEDSDLVSRFGINPQLVEAVVSNSFEGQIDTGVMMKSLTRLAVEKGIILLSGANVKSIQPQEAFTRIEVQDWGTGPLVFTARKVAICTNAFAKQFLTSLNISPGRGLILVTNPISNLKIKGAFHLDRGYYYFRDLHSRVLLGGGRNLDDEVETTLEFGVNAKIYHKLKQMLGELVLPGIPFGIDYQWSGIMAFGSDKRPLIGRENPNLAYAVGLGGMGVAIGTHAADRLARILCLNEIA